MITASDLHVVVAKVIGVELVESTNHSFRTPLVATKSSYRAGPDLSEEFIESLEPSTE